MSTIVVQVDNVRKGGCGRGRREAPRAGPPSRDGGLQRFRPHSLRLRAHTTVDGVWCAANCSE